MKYHGHKVEVLEPGTKIGQMRRCRVAIDNVPSISFEVHEADFQNFPNDILRNQFLARQAMGLIESYGDGRMPRQVMADSLRC